MSNYNRGPEILDFRESWLREIAMYQDHVKSYQLYSQYNQNGNKDLQKGPHLRSSRNIENDQFEHSKVGLDHEAKSDKVHSPQYIVNTYHAQLLKNENKNRPQSPTRVKNKQRVEFDVKRHPSKHYQRLSARGRNVTKPSNKNFSNTYHAKMIKSPKKRPKSRHELTNQRNRDNPFRELNTSHRDANFTPTDNQNDLPLTSAQKVIVNPYHAKLVLSQKDTAKVPAFQHNITIPKAHIILENIHRTLNAKQQPQEKLENAEVQIEKPKEVPIDPKVQDIIAESTTISPTKPTVASTSTPPTTAQPSNVDNQSSIERDSEDSALDDDFADLIDDDELVETSSDSENEYIGHVYLCDAVDEVTSYTDETSPEDSEVTHSTPTSPLSPSLFPNVPPYISFSSHVEKGPTIPNDLQRILKWKMTSVMPKIVRYVVANTGFRLLRKTNDWMGTWDKHMKSSAFKEIRSHQKYNHLPGSFRIGRKDSIWRSLKLHINKHGKKEFGFMRRTFVLPQDLPHLKRAWIKYSKLKTKWIIKPPASARGFGVKLASKWAEIPQNQTVILQKYIERPLLINGSKFDLRLYVLITSVNPLRIYIHNEGLVRFASVQYSDKMETIHDRCMHLTNYSVNKLSSNYVKNEDVNACEGHKWTLKALWTYFRQRNVNTKRLWGMIRNLVVRTVLVGEAGIGRIIRQTMSSKYSCFELFGFDVLLDENLTPWLLEVNISPSLHIELPLDKHVKGPLVQAVLNTVSFQIPPKLSKQQQKDILAQFNLSSPLCFDKRIYVTALSSEEAAKHHRYTDKAMDSREDYLDSILENLTPDDIRCLIVAEDELARCSPMERIFPGPNSHTFLQFIDEPRYYSRLLDAWETRYAAKRDDGIKLLKKLCSKGVHLRVTPSDLLAQDELQEDDDYEEDEINSDDTTQNGKDTDNDNNCDNGPKNDND